MWNKATYTFLAMVLINLSAFTQQLGFSNQYLINRYDLNPALTGHNQNFELFTSYRNSWLGVDGAPTTKTLSVNGGLNDKMGVGGSLLIDDIGIFSLTSALGSYAYYLDLGKDQHLSFGLSAGILQNRIDFSDASDVYEDPVVSGNLNTNNTTFTSAFGVHYRINKISAGVAIPRLITGLQTNAYSEDKTVDGNLFTTNTHIKTYLSYDYYINRDLELLPMAIFRMEGAKNNIEIALMAKYKKMLWTTLNYRTGGFALNIGGRPASRIALNYSYEFSASGIAGQSSGTHEVVLGVLLGNKKNKINSIFGASTQESSIDTPYMKYVD